MVETACRLLSDLSCPVLQVQVISGTLIGLTVWGQGQSRSGCDEVGLLAVGCPSLAEGGRSPTGAKDGVSWAAKRAGLWSRSLLCGRRVL